MPKLMWRRKTRSVQKNSIFCNSSSTKSKRFYFKRSYVYYTCFLRIHNIKKSNLHLLTSELILPYPDFRIDFTLETVASNKVKVAILSEVNAGKERICTGASWCMSKSERHYCVTRKESLAVTHFVMYFKHYLFGIHFLVMMNSYGWYS